MPDDDAMDSTSQIDDMMEADQTPPQPPSSQQPDQFSGPNQSIDKWRHLINCVRELVDQGKPSHALQALLMATKERGGEGAVAQMMKRACEIYRDKVQASAVTDELASLFAECAIAEKMLPSTDAAQSIEPPSMIYTEPVGNGISILDQTGRKQIMLDAFSDGSSFVCSTCGGLVSILRKEEHDAYWCCKGV